MIVIQGSVRVDSNDAVNSQEYEIDLLIRNESLKLNLDESRKLLRALTFVLANGVHPVLNL